MPLIKCPNPDCGAMISSQALSCPKCGHPVGMPANHPQQQTPYQQPYQQSVNQPQPGGFYQPQNQPPQGGFYQPQNQPPQGGFYQPQNPCQPDSRYGQNTNTEDKNSIGLNILSFLIPIVGWILYFVHRKQQPVKAKGCATWGWIGFGVNMLLTIISNS